MDDKNIQSLISADVASVLQRASDPRAAGEALVAKLAAAIEKLTSQMEAAGIALEELPPKIAAARQTVEKCEVIIKKAEADGRAELAAAARSRQGAAAAQLDDLGATLDQAGDVVDHGGDLLEQLEAKRDEASAQLEALGPAPRPAAAPSPGPARPPEAAPAGPSAAASPAAAGASSPAPAKSGDALDDEFAALMAEMGETLPVAKRPSGPTMADDDDDFAIPDLIEVGSDELPEGEELPPLEAPGKGKAAPGKALSVAAKAGANAAPGGARLPAAARGALPATGGAGAPPKSRARLWVAVGTTIIVVGGAVGALFAFGIF